MSYQGFISNSGSSGESRMVACNAYNIMPICSSSFLQLFTSLCCSCMSPLHIHLFLSLHAWEYVFFN
ncbi:hypothetical protein LIER_09143 [Lithospermum erythrorhizon]|uniref:Uncharacterized protein n=1 Tax=Lithospermum erythrorhizon TaxID=34254 RepID=A0AAV3PEM7_LITER